jgi:hypothetical protein
LRFDDQKTTKKGTNLQNLKGRFKRKRPEYLSMYEVVIVGNNYGGSD